MSNCKRCGKEFIPVQGLLNYCSLSCRNTRTHSEETKQKQRTASIKNNSGLRLNQQNNKPKQNSFCKIYYNSCKVCFKTFIVPAARKHVKCCSQECFKKQDGGYRENSVKSNGQWIEDSYGNNVFLQSAYEVKCAQILNAHNLKWTRPSYFEYVLPNSNKTLKYYPDFYLPDLNVYLDPKNKLLQQRDYYKIKSVRDQNNINVMMFGSEYLNDDLIKFLGV